jgi:hypothetical protein
MAPLGRPDAPGVQARRTTSAVDAARGMIGSLAKDEN